MALRQEATQQAHIMPQPLNPSDLKKEPVYMQASIHAKREAYEDDQRLRREAFMAGGYEEDLWRRRYEQDAFAIGGLSFAPLVQL